jgi:RimJ/RimL family protein N-acetyltransferase
VFPKPYAEQVEQLTIGMVAFVEMTGAEFAKWRELSVKEYAADKVRAGNYDEEKALESSEKEFSSFLPEGPKTKGHYLYSVVDERSNERVGIIWYGETRGGTKDTIWIYDIHMHEQFRGRGYGTAALRLLEDRARGLGKNKIGLQVFAHNERARKLYAELGYVPTNIMMTKDL